MKIPRRIATGHLGMNMTPMIDVVFLLIIFFLVSSHLARQENEVPMALPSATSGEEDDPLGSHRITLNVMPDGKLLMGGSTVPPEQLGQRLRDARAKHRGPMEFRVRADRTVDYRHVAPLLSSAAEAGIWDVTFAVVQGASGR